MGQKQRLRETTPPLLYRAAMRGVYGRRFDIEGSGVTDALFIYLDGEPSAAAIAMLEKCFRARPWVCLTPAWEDCLCEQYPLARVFRRWQMKPSAHFSLPKTEVIPKGYHIASFDEVTFAAHPFSHGVNYPSYEVFCADGSGAVAFQGDQIVSSASSFLSLDGEVELDVSTLEAHQGRGLASACIAHMLRDCDARGIVVHWDAQNDISKHLAEKYGFEVDTEYSVYWLPATT